jgi:hypothetical protein
MKLSEILANFAGKTKAIFGTSMSGEWLDSPEGQRWEQVGELVYNELELASVNVKNRRIILETGGKLTINQVSRNIADKSANEFSIIRANVMEWIEEAADAIDDDDDHVIQMNIRAWLKDERKSARNQR